MIGYVAISSIDEVKLFLNDHLYAEFDSYDSMTDVLNDCINNGAKLENGKEIRKAFYIKITPFNELHFEIYDATDGVIKTVFALLKYLMGKKGIKRIYWYRGLQGFELDSKGRLRFFEAGDAA